MKIRNRLIMAFIIIIVLPIVLISIMTGMIMYYTVDTISQHYDIEATTSQVLTNPNYFVIDAIDEITLELKEMLSKNPDKILDKQYVDKMNKRLLKQSSFMVVVEGEEIRYIGDNSGYKDVIKRITELPKYNTGNDSGLYIDGRKPYLLRKTDFVFADGKIGSLYIITELETFLPQVKQSCMRLILCVIGAMFFTASLLVLWLYQSMIRPVNILKTGIYKMKNGDLDFTIKAHSDDELGRLCDDFEDMRKQVKNLMEERYEYEEQMKMLISNISHDLKTPLTAIKGYSEGILDGVADTKEKRDKYLKTIYTKASDMTYLVEELSFYSKIDTNKIPYNFVKVNLKQYFSDCIDDLRLDLEVKHIELLYHYNADPDMQVLLDTEQLKRVINNVIGNSVKYMNKDQGKITVDIDQNGSEVEVSLEDNGKGVAKKDIEKIFERFYRTDQSRNSSKRGSGLGLAIAKKIIMDHGGRIWAEGEEGKGLKVIFTLIPAREKLEQQIFVVEEKSKRRSERKRENE